MSARTKAISKEFDGISISIYLALIAIGWLMIGATNTSILEGENPSLKDILFNREALWVLISLSFFLACFIVDSKLWDSFAWIIYAFGVLLLLGVLLFGENVKGATSWYNFMGYSFQPAEFAKFSTSLGLSAFLSLRTTSMSNIRHQIIIAAIIFLPVALILMQPDAGSAIVFISFFIVLYRAGARGIYYLMAFFLFFVTVLSLMYDPKFVVAGLLVVSSGFLSLSYDRPIWILATTGLLALFSIVFIINDYMFWTLLVLSISFIGLAVYTGLKRRWNNVVIILSILALGVGLSFSSSWAYENVLKPHQQDRINVWLNPEKCDPQGSLYNVNQSKIAIGSGGFYGKGFLKGEMTKLNYVPEQSTDFIVSTMGEEQGFIGILGVIILLTILIIRISIIGERADNTFVCYFAYCTLGIIFFQSFVNIGMAMGFMPVIGIPLPFISKGGSALLALSLMLGILIKLDMERRRV